MGLDMYIFKTNKNEGAIRKLVNDIEKAIQADIQDSVCIGGSYIIMRFIGDDKENSFDKLKPVAYWRKANHIHEWMSKNVLGNKQGKRKAQRSNFILSFQNHVPNSLVYLPSKYFSS